MNVDSLSQRLDRLKARVGALTEKFDPSQARDETGRWTSTGGAIFASPNVAEDLKLGMAQSQLHSQRHSVLTQAFRAVDGLIGGRRVSMDDAIGAWKDGAEDATVTMYRGVSMDDLKLAAAMKGLLSDQKSVLAFKGDPKGEHAMYEMTVPGRLADIHKQLLDDGVAFHTLVDRRGSTTIYSVAFDRDAQQAFHKFRGRYEQVRVKVHKGNAELVGGDTREQGRVVYESLIRGARGAGVRGGDSAARWERLRNHWSERLQAVEKRAVIFERMMTKGRML